MVRFRCLTTFASFVFLGIVVLASITAQADAQTIFQGTVAVVGGEAPVVFCQGFPPMCQHALPDGSVGVSVNGQSVGAVYQPGSTEQSVASDLCNQMNSSFPIQCTGTSVNSSTGAVDLSIQGTTDFIVGASCTLTFPPGVIGCSFTPFVTGQFDVGFKVLSLLYAAPGNASNNGFSNATSNGTTTTISDTFTGVSSTEFSSSGSFGIGMAGFSFGVSNSSGTGTSSSFQVTTTQGNGAQISSNKQAIDHTADQFFLWLNPQVTVNAGPSQGAGVINYLLGTPNGQPMDVINVNVAGLQNPSSIPLDILLPQTPLPGVTLPGLSQICKNHLPPSECTQANACGCVPSDFAAILALDPLIGTSETTPPSSIGANRYTLVTFDPLEGPQQQGAPPVKHTFMIMDSNLTSQTFTQATGESSSYTTSAGLNVPPFFSFGLRDTQTFSWTNSQSQGSSNGTANSALVTFGSSNVGCLVDVDIYEDTVYHTFAFAYPTTPPANCLDQ